MTTNTPVLVGAVPLFQVQSLTINEGYRIQRIAGSRFVQAVAPTNKTIAIEAVLLGEERGVVKKALEALALVSRALVAQTAPLLGVGGIPVVTGLTVNLDMQITDLRFSQNASRRDALDVSLQLLHVPRSGAALLAGEIGELALAAGSALAAAPPPPNPLARGTTGLLFG